MLTVWLEPVLGLHGNVLVARGLQGLYLEEEPRSCLMSDKSEFQMVFKIDLPLAKAEPVDNAGRASGKHI